METEQEKLEKIVEILKKSKNILFITGAGISADSGLPTYRGIGGLYNEESTEDGMTIDEAISGAVMRRHPEITWKYLAKIEQSCRNAKPNTAHKIISRFQEKFKKVIVLTQNIDGLHNIAGSKNVIDIHGNLYNLYCTKCNFEESVESYSLFDTLPPSCPKCGANLRPDVVLFGEMLPSDKYNKIYEELSQGFDIIFSIGTTSIFPYIAQPILYAKQKKIPTVEINPGVTQVSSVVNIKIESGAATTMEKIWNMLDGNV